MGRETRFGSLEHFEKGGVQVINDDPRNYAFSNIFEVASRAEPYEKVAVGKNLKYVLEAIRAEGTSPWYAASHDEAAIVMDGEVEIRLVKLEEKLIAEDREGAAESSWTGFHRSRLRGVRPQRARAHQSAADVWERALARHRLSFHPARRPGHRTFRRGEFREESGLF